MVLAAILISAVAVMAGADQGGAAPPPSSADQGPAPADGSKAPPVDSRTQYPPLLANSYLGVDFGTINYPFSSHQLQPGFEVQSIRVRHAAAHLVIGHEFTRYLSAQIEYARPIQWVSYEYVNGIAGPHTVWVAVGDLAIKSQVPVTRRLAVFGEGGLAIVSRTGFTVDGVQAVTDAHFASPIVGGGVEFALTPAWDAVAAATYVPSNTDHDQPGIFLGTFGVRYHLRPLPPERVEEARESGFIVPKHLVMAGVVTNAFGYGWNGLVSDTVPVFFGGHAQVARGVALRYQRNIFHTAKRFAVDVGASASLLRTNVLGERLASVSLYPLARWTFLRTPSADAFVSYSLAGPTYLSRRVVDGFDTTSRFTFQDMLAFGFYAGRRRNVFVQLDIAHFSNGNIFPGNPGIEIPLTITVGRGF